MSIFITLDPRNILRILDEIDADPPSYSLSRKAALRRVFSTMACVAVSLLLIHYMKYSSTFMASLTLLSTSLTNNPSHYLSLLHTSEYARLIGYCWWTFWHVIGYVLLPFIALRLFIKAPMKDMGWGWGDTHKHWLGYVLLLTPILFFIALVSQGQDFVAHYPFYPDAGRSWFDLIAWEALYLLQFLCLEFFFRGFMLNALRPAIGANAVWVMCVPYLMIHFPKLWLEATGAILFGLFLGILALRSRSLWGGFFVHAGVAVSMDIASLLKQGKIPIVFLPF